MIFSLSSLPACIITTKTLNPFRIEKFKFINSQFTGTQAGIEPSAADNVPQAHASVVS